MQDRVLVSPEECTSNSNGLLNEDVEIASEDIGGGDKRNREGTMEDKYAGTPYGKLILLWCSRELQRNSTRIVRNSEHSS